MQMTRGVPASTRKIDDTVIDRGVRAFILVAFVASVAAFLAAPLLAIPWSRQPFPGFLVEQTLVVQPVVSNQWSGIQAGIAYPQRIVRAAAQPINSAADFTAILSTRRIGESILVFARFPSGRQQIFPVIELAQFPASDLWRIFWLPYLVGAVYLGIGIWIYRLRGRTRPGSTLALFCIVTALTCALLFDTMTTHRMTIVWSVAVAAIGGVLIELALRFPQEWSAVTRRPWLSLIPVLISMGLSVWAIIAFLFPTDPWTYLPPRQASFRYAALGIVVFLAVMLYRARQGSTAIVRRQARLVTVGSVIAFLPVMIWLVVPLFGVSVEFDPAVFLPPLLVFPIAVGLGDPALPAVGSGLDRQPCLCLRLVDGHLGGCLCRHDCVYAAAVSGHHGRTERHRHRRHDPDRGRHVYAAQDEQSRALSRASFATRTTRCATCVRMGEQVHAFVVMSDATADYAAAARGLGAHAESAVRGSCACRWMGGWKWSTPSARGEATLV